MESICFLNENVGEIRKEMFELILEKIRSYSIENSIAICTTLETVYIVKDEKNSIFNVLIIHRDKDIPETFKFYPKLNASLKRNKINTIIEFMLLNEKQILQLKGIGRTALNRLAQFFLVNCITNKSLNNAVKIRREGLK